MTILLAELFVVIFEKPEIINPRNIRNLRNIRNKQSKKSTHKADNLNSSTYAEFVLIS